MLMLIITYFKMKNIKLNCFMLMFYKYFKIYWLTFKSLGKQTLIQDRKNQNKFKLVTDDTDITIYAHRKK